ncbi:SDR family NAD(P)-dependent oxidoreductase [Streptomyces sp. NPDC007172]|uniref:SDR family NAD(P)-dependent oxidoreductase n=1 Tax=unclassified Streptomyces TaxID=2593676 RepID=UPI0036A7F1E8
MSLHGKSMVVTGAGTGIGRAVARRLLAAGASVTLVGRRAEALREAADTEGGERALVHPADISDEQGARSAAEAAVERFGAVDGLVNNAGLARFAPIEKADLSDLEAMLGVNLFGPVHLIRAALPELRARQGAVVNVSSVGGALAMPNRALYGATKAALNSLTRSLARELAPLVRVNAILPGPVDTPMYGDLGLDEGATRDLVADMVEATPLGRFGTPDDIAGWVCNLLDPEASGWVTGALVAIDGGRSA